MEDMKKNTGKKEMEETEELEISQRMSERADDIDNATYRYLAELLELNEGDPEEKFPWNIEILRKVFDSAVSTLQEYGYAVCNPYVATSESGRQYRCTLSECGCGNCNCQDDFMEKERILSSIEDAIARSGLKVLDGDDDCILVRNSRIDMDFQISVKSLEE
jgi:hypothetical protein